MVFIICVLVASAIVGIVCSYRVEGRKGLILSALIPWFGLLALLLIDSFIESHQGRRGHGTMWPVAQFFGGFIVSGTGLLFYCMFNNKLKGK
jgi:hypothetical protein